MSAQEAFRDVRSLPFVRILARPGTWAFIAALAYVIAVAATAILWRPELLDPTNPAGDPWNYLAAAERLRAGHPLYAIGPGDRPVLGFPGAYALPLLAPPTTAILWVPLLVLPPEVAMAVWAFGGLVAVTATVAWTIRRGGIAVRALVVALSIPLATAALSGNVNAYLVPILMASWLGLVTGRGGIGGAADGVDAAARVGPALVGVLYLARRRWVAAATAAATVGAIALLSVIVVGVDQWVLYLRASLGGSIAPTGLSAPGLLVRIGVGDSIARLAVAAVWVVAAAAIFVLRDRPRTAFVVAIVAAVYATPVVRMESWALLLAAVAPWVCGAPIARRHAESSGEGSGRGGDSGLAAGLDGGAEHDP